MKLSIIVPCYNEEKNVDVFHSYLKDTFDDVTFDYEIVFINDGSTDKTLTNLKSIFKQNSKNIKIIDFSRNFGKESAIYAGIVESKGDYVSIIDSDMQQDPKIILDMVKLLDNNEEYDCITAYQKKRKESKPLVFLKNNFYKIITKITKLDFINGASDFRTFRRNMANSIIQMSEYHRFSKGIFAWIGFNTHYIPYEASERFTGETKWSFFKLLRYAIDGIVAFTTMPLKISSFVGAFTALISIIYLIVVIIQKLLYGIDVPGYATTIVLILFLGGLQLSALGIIGQYLSKIYIQTKNRPIYIAKEILSYESKDESENNNN